MDSKYILNLFNQFHKAVGISTKDWTSQQFIFAFSDWLKEYKKVVELYSLYIQYLNIDLSNPFLAEVEKGKYDSIAKDDTVIISSYANTLKKEKSSLFLLENIPLIATPRGIIKVYNIDCFLTHNPYSEHLIYNWYKIHNEGLINICIGVYGKLHDKDKLEKIEMLERLKQKMYDNFEENYDELGDNYFYNIKSSKKTLKKILVR